MRSICTAIRAMLFAGVIVGWFCPAVSAEEASETTVFRAGAAKSNITPPLGVSLVGSMRDRKATHVHDELHARSLVLDDGKTRIAIVVCDLLALDKAAVVRAKKLIQEHTGIPTDHVLIAATHTHTGPATVPVFQCDPEQDYIDWLVVRIADTVRRAVSDLRPARVGWGVGREDRVVFNRRYFMKPGTMPPNPWGSTSDRVKMNPGQENPNVVRPAGPIDPAVSILAVQDTEGAPIAVLGNYTLHYVGGGRGSDVSADYFGMWAAIIEREWNGAPNATKPPPVAILTNGCSGDINNTDVRHRLKQPYPYHQMQKVARLVADESLHVLRAIEYRDWVPLASCETHLEFAVRKPSEQDIQEARGILQEAGAELRLLKDIYARETVLLSEWKETVETPIQALGIGDAAIVTFPGEAFVELGLEVKAKSPFPLTFCIELANDYIGYIPTVAGHDQGGYETWRARSSYLETNAAPTMVSTALDLLGQIHSARGQD